MTYAAWVEEQLDYYAAELHFYRALLNQGIVSTEEFAGHERRIEACMRQMRELREPVERDSA